VSDRDGGERPLSDAFAAAVDAAPGTVYRRAADGDQPVAAASDSIEALTGYDADVLGGPDAGDRGWLDVVRPEDREELRERVADAAPGERVETTYRIRTAEGDERWVDDRFEVADDGASIEGVALDATGAVAQARADAAMLDGIFESVPVHIYVKDAAGRHRKVSDTLERSDELLGKRDADLEFVDGEHGRRATEADMRVIETGEPILDEEEHLPEIGHWNLSSKVPLRDADGDVTGLIGVTRRITERKRAQQELERKTERLEDFADVVSHDIRNPLSVARGFVDLARGAEDREEYLDEVADSLDRADAIVDDVLALSRHDRIELEEESVSLMGVARSAWRSVTTASATLELPDDEVALIADRSQLSRLLENLFRNSVEHGGDGVTIAVEATADGFAVEDDGPGIPPEEREKVFEMAYTTEESGSGLGLGIVAEVADAHGWSVEIVAGRPDDERSESSGARFEITGVRYPEEANS